MTVRAAKNCLRLENSPFMNITAVLILSEQGEGDLLCRRSILIQFYEEKHQQLS